MTASLEIYSYYNSAQPTWNVLSMGTGATPLTYSSFTGSNSSSLSFFLILLVNAPNVSPVSSQNFLSFYTKTVASIPSPYAPLRINFILPSPSLSAAGTMTIVLPSSQYTYTNTFGWVCYFRSYTTESYYTQSPATCTVTASPPLTIVATASAALAANVKHQLVVESSNGVMANDFAVYSSVTANTFKVTFANSGTTIAFASNIPLYTYKPTHIAQPASLYATNIYSSDANTLIMQVTTTSAITAYPNYLMEINFPSASSALINFGATTAPRTITCGLIGLTARSIYAQPRCVLVQSTIPKVRIENFDALPTVGTTFSVILYDLANTVIAVDSVRYLDINFVVKAFDFTTRYEGALLKMFTPTTGSASPLTTSSNFPTHSAVTSYYTAATLTATIAFAYTCSSCKFIVRGTNTNYVFTGSLTVTGTAGSTTLFDTVNNIFGIFFLLFLTNPLYSFD